MLVLLLMTADCSELPLPIIEDGKIKYSSDIVVVNEFTQDTLTCSRVAAPNSPWDCGTLTEMYKIYSDGCVVGIVNCIPLPCIIVVDEVLELVVPEKTTISKPTSPKTKVYYTLLGQKLTNIEFYKGIYIEINEKNESIIKIK